jgi:hypothetical protein
VRPGTGAAATACRAARRAAPAVNLRAMHGMLSAAILIGVFAVVAVACLYLAVRAFAAGRG